MPIYEGLRPQTALIDGTYTARLSNDRHEEPLEVVLTELPEQEAVGAPRPGGCRDGHLPLDTSGRAAAQRT